MAALSDQKFGYTRRKASQVVTFCVKEERNASFKKVTSILQKPEIDRTDEEKAVLFSCSDLVKEVNQRIAKRRKVKDRLLEVQDEPEVLEQKCIALAEALAASNHLVVYTGAGISTSACIPDYRGTNGIWTLLQQGKDIGRHDLTQAEPTRTHMALAELHRVGLLRHVVSQNCDGLHLRSGLPKSALSEVHGNMYIEVCVGCQREYWRLFDVTEHTGRFAHRTMRRCYACAGPLADTIVHFGERGSRRWPLNWAGASTAADAADAILCIGSSLKVLRKYPWLWGMDKPARRRPKLFIVNLQWTPKDDQAVLKVNARCDDVMDRVMRHLRLPLPTYRRLRDPMFHHASTLHPLEVHTCSQPDLQPLDAVGQLRPGEMDQCSAEVGLRDGELDLVKVEQCDLTEAKTDRVKVEQCTAMIGLCDLKSDVKSDLSSELVKAEPGRAMADLTDTSARRLGLHDVFNACGRLFAPMFSLPVLVVGRAAFQLDHNYSKTLSMLASAAAAVAPADEEPCGFCADSYASPRCLFYARREPVFAASAAVVCECCDEEDENAGEEPGEERAARPAVVQPGWYGKGCRKRGRKKR